VQDSSKYLLDLQCQVGWMSVEDMEVEVYYYSIYRDRNQDTSVIFTSHFANSEEEGFAPGYACS
jgi:hypothetical protein